MMNFLRKNKDNIGAALLFTSVVVTMIVAIYSIGLVFDYLRVRFNLPVSTDTPPIVIGSATPSQFPDYDSISSMASSTLIANVNSGTKDGRVESVVGHLKFQGKFSRLYLYLDISVNKKQMTDWDSIFVDFGSTGLKYYDGVGGHIFRPNTLDIPTDVLIGSSTKLLFNTSVIPYIYLPYSSKKTPQLADAFTRVFNNPIYGTSTPTTIIYESYISTTLTGTINKMTLYYECELDTPKCFIQKID